LKVAEDLKVAGKKAIDDAAKAFQKTKNNIHKGLQKIGTDVVDAVEDVGEKIVNSDVGQFVKGAIQLWTESKASKAVTNVVDCIANKGSAKGGDPTETILRLTENIDKFLKVSKHCCGRLPPFIVRGPSPRGTHGTHSHLKATRWLIAFTRGATSDC